jgi:hypothetical protein
MMHSPYIRMMPRGNRFFLENPQPDDYDIPTIVHHMARIARYTGATTYTNGQHSTVAARMAARFYPDHALLPARMLIHDMAEHVLGDVSAPLKSLLPDYRRLEAVHDLCVERRFDLTFIGDALVREVDQRMLATEFLVTFPDADEDFGADPFPLEEDDLLFEFTPWATEVVEHEFRMALACHLPWVQQ